MITFDPKYIFTATQSTVIIYFVIILFNIIFWIVDSVRGNAPSPEHASPPLLTVLIGLLLGFLVALPITFVPRSRVLLDTRLIHDSWRKGCRDERTKARGGFGGGRP